MRKDYIALSEKPTCGQTAWVESYWQEIWKTRNPHDPAPYVERHEQWKIMKPYLENVPKGGRILDGGCGLGEWTRYLANLGFSTCGLDLGPETVSRLTQLFPNNEFAVGDIRKIPFPDGSFDAYFSWGTFEHFEEGLAACINEAWRVLKPAGYLFVSVPFQNWRHLIKDLSALQKWDEAYQPGRGYGSAMQFYQWRLTRPELKRELEMRGFDVLRTAPVHKQDGFHRMLENDWGLQRGGLRYRVALKFGSRLAPASWISHMLMAVARKR